MNIFRYAVIIATILFCGTAMAVEKNLKSNMPAAQQGVVVPKTSPIQKEPVTSSKTINTMPVMTTTAPIQQTGPDRYVFENGMVRDKSTGLMWAANDNGSNINWANAKIYCENYHGGGYSGWRTPKQDELAALYAGGGHKNKIKITGGIVWASEPGMGTLAATFYFGAGHKNWNPQAESSPYRALPVRSGN